ncbi:MAG: B12-binding domain-containing radical SAM protein [Phycisphaerae bacterium]
MRILLVQPEAQDHGVGFRVAAMPEPLALEMLAACLGDKHTCRILDMRIDADLQTVLADFGPDMVAVTALTPEVYAAIDVCRQTKAHNVDCFTLIGGHHAGLLPDDFFHPAVDAVALGEGELVFPQLVAAVEGRSDLQALPNLILRNDSGAFVRNETASDHVEMDALALPRRDLVADYRQEYFFLFDKPDSSVATGRGCPYRCNFCSVWKFYAGRTRQMCPERVIQEVRHCDTGHITFVDDNFLMNYRRENEIADRIQAEGINLRYSMECRTDSIVRHPELVEKWVDVGLYAVLLGLEGASDKTLTSVNKQNSADTNNEAIRILQDNGVIIWGAFIVDPQWDVDDFKALRNYVTEKQITHTQFTILTPLPGTDLYHERKDQLITSDYRCFDTMHSVLPTKLDRQEFYAQFANLYRQTDLGPYYDLVREGKLTIEDCKRGKQMLDSMSIPERYFDGDPILGNRRKGPEHLTPAAKTS